MLKTDLLPYDDVADLFIIDPDGFIIRKWNSKQLNNGLMTAEFQVTSIISSLHRNNIFLFFLDSRLSKGWLLDNKSSSPGSGL